ncbi:MAG: MFS transporter [Kiritimatiellae bacterium]|nr:MFS transporter [Kiritimatiellia bacterium]
MMKNDGTRLIALCSAIYFTSYLTRKAYEASILAICDDTGLARTAAGLAGTATVAVYGGGQFFTGWLADRVNPGKIVLAALLLTSACNAALPVAAGSVAALVAVNALNGFAQAMFWPPLVKIFAGNLTAERYKVAVFAVNVAANAAIVAVFALVAGCIRFAGWRLSFWTVAAVALAMAAVWRVCGSRLQPDAPGCARQQSAAVHDARRRPAALAAAGLLPVALAIVCMGVMRDGIEAWAPSIVNDVFGLGASGSTLSVALLPAFAVASMSAARWLRTVLGDEIKVALVLFALGLACAAALLATGGGPLAAGLPLLAILSAAMHGANLMLVCELPGRFAKSGRVGTISGILNSGVYVGAALSIYGFAALRDHFAGWRPVFALWMATIAAGIVLLALALRAVRRGRP